MTIEQYIEQYINYMKKFKVGFSYTYQKDNELISGVLEHISPQGDRYWCKETYPDGFVKNWNYNESELHRVSTNN